MTVSKSIERLEHSALKLTVTIDKGEVKTEYDKLLADYSKSLQIPGFRKGHVPRDVLVRKFGEAFSGETLNNLIEKSLTQIFDDPEFKKEDKPLAYSTPELEGDAPKLDLESDLSFAVKYDVLPQITVGTWKGLEVEIPQISITDEDLNKELKEIQERNAVVLDRSEGSQAQDTDVVTVNYCELADDGSVIPGTERQDYVFTLGTEANVFRFDKDMLGMKVGDSIEVSKSFEADDPNKELAGQTKKIRVTLTALKEKKLPDLDDDLAQDVDEKYKTLEDLKKSIRDRLEATLAKRLKEITVSKILEKVLETTPVEVPESMMRVELEGRWRAMARQFNADPDQMAEMMERSGGGGRESIFEGWRGDAEKALKSRLVVETLMRDLNLEASDEECEKEIETVAAESGASLEDVKKYYDQENMREYLKEDVKERKLFDMMIAENTVKAGAEQKFVDLLSNNG